MQKVKEAEFIRYPKMRIFKDDIETLITIFEQNFDDVETIVGEYKITKFSDVDLINQSTVKSLSIKGRHSTNTPSSSKENMSLELKDYKAELYLSDKDNIQLRGIEHHINTILLARKRKTAFLSNYRAFITLIFSVDIVLFMINYYTPYFHGEIPKLIITYFPVLAIIWMLLDKLLNKKYTIIELIEHSKKAGFFARKRDDLLVNAICTLLGVIAGSIATIIIQLVMSSHTH